MKNRSSKNRKCRESSGSGAVYVDFDDGVARIQIDLLICRRRRNSLSFTIKLTSSIFLMTAKSTLITQKENNEERIGYF